MLRRSQLFVPAHDERKVRKSVGLGADSIVFDFEDSVPDDQKTFARECLCKLTSELDWDNSELCVRINKVGSGYSREDIAAVRSIEKIRTLVLPKAEKIWENLNDLEGFSLIPLAETALGVLGIEKIANTSGVVAISLGAQDLANSVGGDSQEYGSNTYVKTKLAIACAAFEVEAIDCVYFDLNNAAGFRKAAEAARALGFKGKQVVHPSQIQIANQVFSPSEAELLEARRIVGAYEASASERVGAIRLDGKLVDAVHYRRAKSLLNSQKKIENRV